MREPRRLGPAMAAVERDQPRLGRVVEGVERNEALGCGDCHSHAPFRLGPAREFAECARGTLPEAGALGGEPLLVPPRGSVEPGAEGATPETAGRLDLSGREMRLELSRRRFRCRG